MTLTATPPKEDRYDRLRVQGFGAVWLQPALLEQGLARVVISPDRNDCAPELYEAEGRARECRRPGSVGARLPMRCACAGQRAEATPSAAFQIVEGWVTECGPAAMAASSWISAATGGGAFPPSSQAKTAGLPAASIWTGWQASTSVCAAWWRTIAAGPDRTVQPGADRSAGLRLQEKKPGFLRASSLLRI